MGEGLPSEPTVSGDTTRFSNALFFRSFGDYELLQELARGGMGTIFKARQRSLGRIVAVKVLSSGEFASPEFVRRFKAEAAAAARLQHPNIVAVHEVGENEGIRYFSMDYVEGPNLAQLLGGRPLEAGRAALYLKTIAEAVQYAHDRGLLHRDLKPSNVLIDPFGEPRLTDFGLAKDLSGDSDLTVTGQVLGTPGYLPPEQADSSYGPITPAADIYSLGAILYFMLTTRAPFAAGTLQETLRQVLTRDPVAPSVLNPEVPMDLETICLKCLERDPTRRYDTATALAEDCRRFLEKEPIVARPLSAVGRLTRWCRRRPSLATIWLLILLLAATSTVSSLWVTGAQSRTVTALAQVRSMEATGRKHLRDARLSEARALRRTTLPGRREKALAALAEASRIQPGADLRDEALAVLMLPDVRLRAQWDIEPPVPGQVAFDPKARVLAYEPRNSIGSERGPAQLRRWGVKESFAELAVSGTNRIVGPIRFSADGRLLMGRYLDQSLRVWRVGEVEPFLVLTNRPLPNPVVLTADRNSDYDFSPDGTTLVLGLPEKGLSLHRVADGSEVARWTGGEKVDFVRFSPDGTRVAAVRVSVPDERRVFVLKTPSMVEEQVIRVSYSPSHFAWSGDSRQLATASSERVVSVSDLPGHRLVAALLCPGLGPGDLMFVGADSLIALRGTGTTLRLVSPTLGQEELVMDGLGPSGLACEPGGMTFVMTSVEGVASRWEVLPPVGFRVIPPPRPAAYDMTVNGCCFDFHPTKRWVVSSHGRYMLLRDVESGRFFDEYDAGRPKGLEFGTVAFLDGGGSVLRCSTTTGIQRFTIQIDDAGDPHFGEPKSLDSEKGFIMTDHTADGGRLALVDPEMGRVKVVQVGLDGVAILRQWTQHDAYSAALDPTGENVLVNCAGSKASESLQRLALTRVADGSMVRNLPARPCGEVAWSANGKSVLTSNGPEESIIWDGVSWGRKITLGGRVGGNITTFALSPDGSYAVVARDEEVSLVSCEDGRILARIECPAASGLAAGARFLPDSRRFALLWRDGRIDIFDPVALRSGLTSMGLAW